MKVIAFALLLAFANATPNRHASDIETAIRSGQERLVTGNIVSAIEDAAQAIRDAGLDPLNIPALNFNYELPVPTVLNARANHGGIYSSGLSNIVINRMNYALLTSRLTFNIELPWIMAGIRAADLDVNVLGGNFNSKIGGSVEIRNIVVTGDIRVSVGVITGISIRSMELTLSLGAINSNMNVEVQDWNLSAYINEFLSYKIPNAMKEYERDINDLITIVGKEIVEANL